MIFTQNISMCFNSTHNKKHLNDFIHDVVPRYALLSNIGCGIYASQTITNKKSKRADSRFPCQQVDLLECCMYGHNKCQCYSFLYIPVLEYSSTAQAARQADDDDGDDDDDDARLSLLV